MMGEGMGQCNLVPNWSFDSVINCATMTSAAVYYGYVPPWDSPTDGSQDAFNTCVPNIPNTGRGFQNQHSGNGFVGGGFYSYSGIREYLQVKLDSPLVMQQWYCASFYVNLANISKIAINNFGMYFSNSHYYLSGSTGALSWLTPQINDTNIVSDTVNWTLVYGQYQAVGGEQYIIIGNFHDNSTTDTTRVSPGVGCGGCAYYFIDDVNVHCCTCDSTTSIHASVTETNPTPSITLYPNPAADKLTVNSEQLTIKEVHIYNVLGQLALSTPSPLGRSGGASVDVSQLPSGLYFAEILTNGSAGSPTITRRKFVKQ